MKTGDIGATIERYSSDGHSGITVEYRLSVRVLPSTGCLGIAVDTSDTELLTDLALVCVQAAKLLRECRARYA